jgi:uncharacterized protein (DUF433 family)
MLFSLLFTSQLKEECYMTFDSNVPLGIIRTERGLTIVGTRITVYDLMDYLTSQYPPNFIRGLFNLTQEQMNCALAYIDANLAEVEAEYKLVLQEASQNRHYWEERNKKHFENIAKMSPKLGREDLWAKLQAQKAKHELQA